MGTQYEKKITWTIKNFSSLQSEKIYSLQFTVGGCKWRFLVYPKGIDKANYLSLYLGVPDSETLPSGWKRHTKFRLIVVNQRSEEFSEVNETISCWFDEKTLNLGYPEMLPLTKLLDQNGGFLVNGEVKIAAEVDVLEAIGKSDVLDEISYKTMDVNGFQVLPSQVESVNSLFKKHPDLASRFGTKNPHLRATYLNVLLSLTEILNKSPNYLSSGDMADAYSALRFVTQAGFKLDWLEKKLKEVGEVRMQEIEEESKNLKRKCGDMDALVDFLRCCCLIT